MDSQGERFARAVAHQDADALCAVLAGTVDFQALTPRRHWQASTGRQAAEEIILGQWFDAGTQIVELCSVATGQVADCAHVAYRMHVREAGDDYLVEQQAYYRTDGPRITWMRILCSGYRPMVAEPAAARG
ncbi:MAG TPA: hypothetical protein VGI05_01965 [Streptosporangiaceae bacterium]